MNEQKGESLNRSLSLMGMAVLSLTLAGCVGLNPERSRSPEYNRVPTDPHAVQPIQVGALLPPITLRTDRVEQAVTG